MRFRVTSVAGTESGRLLNDATVRLEDWLNTSLSDGNFGNGVDQFVIVAVSVDDPAEENARWANPHDKTGRYKNKFTGESVRFISSAVLLPPSQVISKTQATLLPYFCRAIVERLGTPPKRVPKGFDYARCSNAISVALEVYA